MTCTFFGHRYVPNEIEPALRSVLLDLIEKDGVRSFYVGNQGGFDAMVQRVLEDLAEKFPITCTIVLAYLPDKKDGYELLERIDTVLPEGIEYVPKKFAIAWRTKWMLNRADVVVTYVRHENSSGAGQFKQLAERRGKKVLNLKLHRLAS